MRMSILLALLVSTLASPAYTQEIEAAEATKAAAKTAPPPVTEGLQVQQILATDEIRAVIEEIDRHMAAREEAAPAETAPPGRVLTLRECVAMTLANNPQVAIAADDVEAALARIEQARSAIKPQVSGRIAHVWNDRGYGGTSGLLSGGLGGLSGGRLGGGFGGGGGGGGSPLLSLAANYLIQRFYLDPITESYTPDNTTIVEQLTLQQVLYAGGQIRAAIRAAKALAGSQEWRREVVLLDLEYQTKQAYYDSLLASALVSVALESIRTFERNLADTQEMLNVGYVSDFEALRARTELGVREADLVTARNAVNLSHANLRRILSIPQDVTIALTPQIEYFPNDLPVEHFVQEALANRPEIRAIEKAAEAAGQDLRRIKGQYLPRVAVQAEYSNTEDGGKSIPDGWLTTLGADWEFYAGGKRKAERKEAESKILSLEHQLEDLQQLIELDVKRAHILVQDSMAQIRSTRGTVDLAREGLRLAELRFEAGAGTQSETLDAELALTNAQTALFQALRDFAVGNAALERAIAKSWIPRETAP